MVGAFISTWSGDGRGPYRWASREPSRLFVASDSNAAALTEIAWRAGRKPKLGGVPNLICIAATAASSVASASSGSMTPNAMRTKGFPSRLRHSMKSTSQHCHAFTNKLHYKFSQRSASGEVRVPLDKDLHGSRQTVQVASECAVVLRSP